MDVLAVHNKRIKKYRVLTSFLVISLSIILLIYTITIEEPAIILAFIIIIKLMDLIFNLYKNRIKKHGFQF